MSLNDPEHQKAFNDTVEHIQKAFGVGALMKLGERTCMNVDGVSSGAIALDIALGGKGLPLGRMVELFGSEMTGKSSLALHTVAGVQKLGGTAAYIDAEHALDPEWAEKLGVDLDELRIAQPDSGEEALQILDQLVSGGGTNIVIVDSVAALTPKAELEGEMGDAHVGLQARMMGQAMRKLKASVSRSKCLVIFINQVRTLVGVKYGSPNTTPGGRALKFFASVRIEVSRIATLKDSSDNPYGIRVKAKVVKNKIAPPFRTAEYEILSDGGISLTNQLIDLGVASKHVKKSGSWYSIGDVKIGQGKENSRAFLEANPQMLAQLHQDILTEHGVSYVE